MPEVLSIKSDDIVEIARGQAVVEAKQQVGNVRVLSVAASCSVTPGEVFTGEARYAGRVRFDVLVCGEGGAPGCVSAVAEFSDRMASPDIVSGADPAMTCAIANAEAAVKDGVLTMTAVVDTCAVAAVHCDRSVMTDTEPGVYAQKRSVEYCTVVSCPSETAYVTDAVGASGLAEVLSVQSCAVVTGVECGDDEVRVSGAVYTSLTARGGDGLISALRAVTPFVKSMSAPGVTAELTAVASACVSDAAAELTADGDTRSVELAVTMQMNATVIDRRTAEVVTDVFCADFCLDTAAEEITACSVEPLATVIDTVGGQVQLGDGPAADTVLCVYGRHCTVTAATVENKRVNVEGAVYADILYYNAESNSIEPVPLTLPFSTPIDIHTDCGCVNVTACVTDITAKLRRGSVFDVKAEIAFTACPTSREKICALLSVKLGEPLPKPDAAVIVHIAKPGETLWQAARALCCSPDRVLEQNAGIDAPYSGGERLINFCARERK